MASSFEFGTGNYIESLECDDPFLEMQFYMKGCVKEDWMVRELKRQINSSLFLFDDNFLCFNTFVLL